LTTTAEAAKKLYENLRCFFIQLRQCRNDKMSLRNGAAAAKKKEAARSTRRRQRRGREKSSLILIDARLSTA
jgi:hypothetical protein